MAKSSEVIEQFITALMEGEPAYSTWMSIDGNAMHRREYHERLDMLRGEVDALFQPTQQGERNA